MYKSLFALVLALCSQLTIAQTLYEEPDLDLSQLNKKVLSCGKACLVHTNRGLNKFSFRSIIKKPAGNAKVTSGYGWRIHPIKKSKQFHNGIDFAVPVGTPVHAGQSGIVVYAGKMKGYGNLLVIQHSASLSTVYGHLNNFMPGIKVGKFVKRGQIVAKSGNTGLSTGPHLHYEIRVNGLAVSHQTGMAYSDRMLVFYNPTKGR